MNRAKILSAYVEGCYLIRLTLNSSFSSEEAEKEAHQKCIEFLEKAADTFNKTDIAISKAIRDLIKEDKKDSNK